MATWQGRPSNNNTVQYKQFLRDAGRKLRSCVRQLSLASEANVTSRMQHLGQFAALLMAMSTLGQLTTGQPTVDSELMNDGCDGSNSSEYVALLRGLLAGQRRLESKLQHLSQSDGFETRESRCNRLLSGGYLCFLILSNNGLHSDIVVTFKDIFT